MKKIFKFAVCMMAAVCSVNLMQMPVMTEAKELTNVVVIGDSISTGAGLADGEKSYVDLLQESGNVAIQNFAQDSFTTADLLESLNDAQIQQALSEADVILVTVGIHDIMDQFLVRANSFMTEFGFEKFTDVFTASLQEHGFTDEMELVPYANTMADDIKANRTEAAANMQQITAKLEEYQNAKIIYQTVYNLLDNIEMYDTLSMKRKTAYNSIMNPTGAVINECYNDYLAGYVEQHENTALVDVYSAFAGNAWQYTNLYELEMNPNSTGHALIAKALFTELFQGDVNGSGKVDASDASAVLIHAASVGAGQGGTLTDAQQSCADVDGNGKVDSQDASQILIYAAKTGAGEDYEFVKSGEAQIVDADPNQPDADQSEIVDADPFAPVVL